MKHKSINAHTIALTVIFRFFPSKLVRAIILDCDVRFYSVIDKSLRTVIFLRGLINLRPQEYKPLTVKLCCVYVIAMTRGLHILVLILRQMDNEENPGITCTEKVISTQHTSETERHEMGRKYLKPPDLTED